MRWRSSRLSALLLEEDKALFLRYIYDEGVSLPAPSDS